MVAAFVASAVAGVALVVFAVAASVAILSLFRRDMARGYGDKLTRQAQLIARTALIASIALATPIVLLGALGVFSRAWAFIPILAALAFYVFCLVSSFLEHTVSLSPFQDRKLWEAFRLNGVVAVAVCLLGAACFVYLRRLLTADTMWQFSLESRDMWVSAIAAKGVVSAFVYVSAIVIRKFASWRQNEKYWIETKLWLAVSVATAFLWIGATLRVPLQKILDSRNVAAQSALSPESVQTILSDPNAVRDALLRLIVKR